MYKLEEFFAILDEIAPIKYSYALVDKGEYDNSGIIVAQHDNVKRVLFSLDLSIDAVKKAKSNNCDTIVTHHPAIYRPIMSIGVSDDTVALSSAVKEGLNVISMHLNLDVAAYGIDRSLAEGLEGKNIEILDVLENGVGYGRKFESDKTVSQLKEIIKRNFKTQRTLFYGDKNRLIKTAACFCGGGSSHAEKMLSNGKLANVDLIVTSDMPHHLIKRFTEAGINLILLTHYAAENYGFKKFYEKVKAKTTAGCEVLFFEDRKFM